MTLAQEWIAIDQADQGMAHHTQEAAHTGRPPCHPTAGAARPAAPRLASRGCAASLARDRFSCPGRKRAGLACAPPAPLQSGSAGCGHPGPLWVMRKQPAHLNEPLPPTQIEVKGRRQRIALPGPGAASGERRIELEGSAPNGRAEPFRTSSGKVALRLVFRVSRQKLTDRFRLLTAAAAPATLECFEAPGKGLGSHYFASACCFSEDSDWIDSRPGGLVRGRGFCGARQLSIIAICCTQETVQ